jgi:hypothetical protein
MTAPNETFLASRSNVFPVRQTGDRSACRIVPVKYLDVTVDDYAPEARYAFYM